MVRHNNNYYYVYSRRRFGTKRPVGGGGGGIVVGLIILLQLVAKERRLHKYHELESSTQARQDGYKDGAKVMLKIASWPSALSSG